MKKLICELCGGVDIVKDGDFFVCQNCGTKYTVETARKMMIEGSVDVSGSTVKVDNSEQIENLYTLARRARETDNAESAEKYYSRILETEPDDWEAVFYSVYYKYSECSPDEIPIATECIGNIIPTAMKLANDSDNVDDIFQEIADTCLELAKTFLQRAENYYSEREHADDLQACKDGCTSLLDTCINELYYTYEKEKIAQPLCDFIDQDKNPDNFSLIIKTIIVTSVIFGVLLLILISHT